MRMSGWTPCSLAVITVPRMANSRVTAKQRRVPINVARRTRMGMAYQRGLRGGGMRSKDQFYYLSSRAPVYHAPTMGMPDAAGEWLRIAEHYRNMSDGELIVLRSEE